MRAVSLVLMLVLAAVFGCRNAEAGESRTPAGHVIEWPDGLGSLAAEIERALPAVEARVAGQLGFAFEGGPARIVVVRNLEGMRAVTRLPVHAWAGGVCVASASLIVIRADRVSPAIRRAPVVPVLRHEWVHLAWARKAGRHTRQLPLWAEEGLAEVVGGAVSVDAGRTLDWAVARGELIPWKEIERRFPKRADRAGLAYRQGASWVAHVARHAGWAELRGILADVAAGTGITSGIEGRGAFDQVLRLRTERTLDDWTADWRTELERTATPWFHLLGHDVGWTLLVFLSVISFWFWYRHRQRRRAEISALPDG